MKGAGVGEESAVFLGVRAVRTHGRLEGITDEAEVDAVRAVSGDLQDGARMMAVPLGEKANQSVVHPAPVGCRFHASAGGLSILCHVHLPGSTAASPSGRPDSAWNDRCFMKAPLGNGRTGGGPPIITRARDPGTGTGGTPGRTRRQAG